MCVWVLLWAWVVGMVACRGSQVRKAGRRPDWGAPDLGARVAAVGQGHQGRGVATGTAELCRHSKQ